MNNAKGESNVENSKINEGQLAEVAGGVPDKNFSDYCYFTPANPVSFKTLRNGGVGVLCNSACQKYSSVCCCYNSWDCENNYHMLQGVEADGFSYLSPKNERGHNSLEKRVYVGTQ